MEQDYTNGLQRKIGKVEISDIIIQKLLTTFLLVLPQEYF
jgi:hypothetical protein